jgi:hypothetical protein
MAKNVLSGLAFLVRAQAIGERVTAMGVTLAPGLEDPDEHAVSAMQSAAMATAADLNIAESQSRLVMAISSFRSPASSRTWGTPLSHGVPRRPSVRRIAGE